MSNEMAQVAVGLDYESDQPWVHVIKDEPWSRADDFEPPWILRDVPKALADEFQQINARITELVTEIHAAAGYDSARGRLIERCAEWQGEPYTSPSNGHVSYEDCRRCGWPHREHQESGDE